MFKRFPHIGWLTIALILWGFVGYRHYEHKVKARPECMADVVSRDLQGRQEALDMLLKRDSVFRKMFSGNLSIEEVNELSEEPFYIYAFEDAVDLVFWNSNNVVSTCVQDSGMQESNSLFRNNGVYYKQCLRLPYLQPNQYVVVLFPIAANYPFQNEYLRSAFTAASYIPVSTVVTEQKLPGSYAVTNANGQPMFHLQFKKHDLPRWIPDKLFVAALLIALLETITWINLLAVHFGRSDKAKWGLALIGGAIGLFLGIIYLFGPPFNLGEVSLFSPRLYASSSVFPSLGVLLLVILCALWIIVYLLRYVRPSAISKKKGNRYAQGGIVVLFSMVLGLLAFGPVDIIRNLIINSSISFDVSDFTTINGYTIVGLFAIGLIACCAGLMVYYLNSILSLQVKRPWLKYLVIILVGLIFLLEVEGKEHQYEYYSYGWLLLFVILQDLRIFKPKSGLFAPNMIFWAGFIALSSTVAVQHFNKVKEQDRRRLFAENIVRQQDDVMEYLFADIADSIATNAVLRDYFQMPTEEDRTFIDEHLGTRFFRGQLNKYEAGVYLYDKEGMPLYNKDPVGINYFYEELNNAAPTESKYLFYRENAKDAHYYLASIPIRAADGSSLGYVFIDMTLKRAATASVYPELLQPARVKENIVNANYTYGIYVGRELITRVNSFPFPVYRRRDALKPGTLRTLERDGYTVYIYKVDKEKTVSIVENQKSWLEGITLFSYMLGVLMVFALTTFIFRLYFQYVLKRGDSEKLIHLTLRKRIHLGMLGVVFISYLIIGAVTIWVFVDRYDDSNRNKLRAAMQVIERSVLQYLKAANVDPDPVEFHAESDSPEFKNYIAALANSQSIDVNIYNSLGSLKATSQDDIYNKKILDRIMMPYAYYELAEQNRTILIEEEQIGKLKYLSCYVPLRNDRGEAFGYINVPFFASEKELNYQISNILVALINLYAFIFLVSSVLAVLITDWLTRGLQMIIERFKQFNLKQNEPLEWKYDDEIGLLIGEYNKMVKKVEENAILLAQSERESAWREMARQVAHEIKNPLTPMKLNIQYLQQALRTNHPNARQLTENVSESLIEQIDNLSHIASAFSDFAKMPEADPEEIDLKSLLYKAAELYLNNTRTKVEIDSTDEIMTVYADKSQLLRVLTNVLQNAVEAIPEDREGNVRVSLEREDHSAIITITDNGNGIEPELVEKIFSPYFTTKGSGTGLGLAMTKKIIEFWKGKIWFETERGKGTSFFIKLPLLQE